MARRRGANRPDAIGEPGTGGKRPGDVLFLDANVLFSAAYRPDAGLRRLWSVSAAQLCTSAYAVEEARRNLDTAAQRTDLAALLRGTRIVEQVMTGSVPTGLALAEKDGPILLGAVQARATHLLTGDVRHFGHLLGRRVLGVLVVTPGDYLREVGARAPQR